MKDLLSNRVEKVSLLVGPRVRPGVNRRSEIQRHLAIAIAAGFLGSQQGAIAQQVVPDSTLGTESSVVVPDVEIQGVDSDRIEGGALRGNNLFHSFQEFNVDLNRGVYFSNPEGVGNILTRVTGGNLSNIDGTLGVLGNANLFLINPNGLVFGSGAQLDLNGSFFGTTADSIFFEEFEFSATDPAAPPPLLTVSVPVGLQLGPSPGEIVARSPMLGTDGVETSFTLVGGEIRLESSGILVPGADVRLGSFAGPGIVELDANLDIEIPDSSLLRADLLLTGGAQVNVAGNGGGSVTAIARNVTLEGGSFIFAGIVPGGMGGDAAGDVAIDATEAVTLQGENAGSPSSIFNQVSSTATGESGGIFIEAGSLTLSDGALVSATTFGVGDAGLVRVRTDGAVVLQGEDSQGLPSTILSAVQGEAMGNSLGIEIEAGSLLLADGALLNASTFAAGEAGQVTIQTGGGVTLQGATSQGAPSGILSSVQSGGEGNSGGVDIQADTLTLLDGTALIANTLGNGDAGLIQIRADGAITVQGENGTGVGSSIASQVQATATGDSQGISITEASSLSLLDGGFISATTLGQGNAGSIEIRDVGAIAVQGESSIGLPSSILNQVIVTANGNSGGILIEEAGSFVLSDGAFLSATTLGMGDAGLIRVRTSGPVIIQGEDSQGIASTILSAVQGEAMGNSLGIEIEAGSLLLADGALLNASTFAAGDAGQVTIRTGGDVTLQGATSQGAPSGILSSVQSGGEGNSGGVDIQADTLALLDGTALIANTLGNGDAGLIQIRTDGAITVQGENGAGVGSSIASQVEPTGMGSSQGIDLEVSSLQLLDGGFISATTLGNGSAGEVMVRATEVVTVQGESSTGLASAILSQVQPEAMGDSGDIFLGTDRLSLLDGGQLTSNTFGNGSAGNITTEIDSEILLQGEGSGIFSTVGAGAGGTEEASGSITLASEAIAIQDNAAIEVDSQGIAPGGDIAILESGSLELSDNASITATAASDEGGSVEVELQENLILRENSFISAEAGTAGGEGQGGTLDIDALFVVAFPGNNDLNANAFNGPGGSITIETEGLFGLQLVDLLNPREVPTNDITVSSVLEGAAGTFELVSPEVDPSQNLAILPVNTLEVASLIDRRCALTASDAVGRFAVVGRGGLPPDPRAPLASSPILADFGTDIAVAASASPTARRKFSPQLPSSPAPLVEARGWQVDGSGQVWLLGSAGVALDRPSQHQTCSRPAVGTAP